MIIRRENRDLVSVPRAVILDKRLSRAARFLYVALIAADDSALEVLDSLTSYTSGQVRKYLDELADYGWVVKTGRGDTLAYEVRDKAIMRQSELPFGEAAVRVRPSAKAVDPMIYELADVDGAFLPVVEEWLAYKRERKQTYKVIGFKKFYGKLRQLSGGDALVARQIIEQSMANNYSGIFPLRAVRQGQETPIGMIMNETREERERKYNEAKGW